jgi:hypothetical protein
VTLQASQPNVEGLQASNTVNNVGSALSDQARQFGGRLGAVSGVTPARDPGGILERDIQPTQIYEQAQVLDIRLAVLAVGVVSSGGPGQPAHAFVEADRVG